jgi:endonuclease VIII
MPEGHTVHRTAGLFRKRFSKKPLRVLSPQGRFTDSAKLISGRELMAAEAFGKQLFLHFDNQLQLRIHLGIYGKWGFVDLAEREAPEPVGQVRARFQNSAWLADLRGPTACEVITETDADLVLKRLGPDPLRPDPAGTEGLRFIDRVRASRTSIGQLLMNQAVIAGVGNVYRAELLFRAGINPHSPGSALTAEQLSEIWLDAVKLMRVGVKTGIMITRDEFLTKRPRIADRYFVYKREAFPCRMCAGEIRLEIMATRKLYWCPSCQR